MRNKSGFFIFSNSKKLPHTHTGRRGGSGKCIQKTSPSCTSIKDEIFLTVYTYSLHISKKKHINSIFGCIDNYLHLESFEKKIFQAEKKLFPKNFFIPNINIGLAWCFIRIRSNWIRIILVAICLIWLEACIQLFLYYTIIP